MTALSADEVLDRLHKLGQAGDDELPLAETALLLANLDRTGLDLTPYRAHLDRLVHDAREALAALRRGMSASDAAARVLIDVIGQRHGYMGDAASYDDPRNADLAQVIDRKRGLPVALGILYLDVAAALGVTAETASSDRRRHVSALSA